MKEGRNVFKHFNELYVDCFQYSVFPPAAWQFALVSHVQTNMPS